MALRITEIGVGCGTRRHPALIYFTRDRDQDSCVIPRWRMRRMFNFAEVCEAIRVSRRYPCNGLRTCPRWVTGCKEEA